MKSPQIIKVGNRLIGPDQPIFLTAEIGISHSGSFENAERMIVDAAKAGCDGVDMFIGDSNGFYFAPFAPDNDTRKVWDEQSFSMEQWRKLMKIAKANDIIIYATPLDLISLQKAADLGVPMININSDDISNLRLLEAAADLGVPITLHDIGASLSEVETAVMTLIENGATEIILLHSTQEAGEEKVLYGAANLLVMETYRSAFGSLGVHVGCVEHTTSDFLIYAVAALKPVLISKHIQVADSGNEHDPHISVDSAAMGTMIKKVRYVEMALGCGHNQKVTTMAENNTNATPRNKVLVANRAIPAGKVIEEADIVAKRPGRLGGLHPAQARLLIGAKTSNDIAENIRLDLNMFENFPEPEYRFPDIDAFIVDSTDNIQGA
ncbi:MAG: N-acetylneuraminate synthase family protein [Victivallaceae bacterium]|nr:N-acetylneuraminate synthase family protein [Victivallaceae bacterium]